MASIINKNQNIKQIFFYFHSFVLRIKFFAHNLLFCPPSKKTKKNFKSKCNGKIQNIINLFTPNNFKIVK